MGMQVACTGSHHAHSTMSVSDFVASTLPLLEMEKNAEVAQVMRCVVGRSGTWLLAPCTSYDA